MLISNEEVNKRLNNPLNLMNKMRSFNGKSKNAMSLFVGHKERNADKNADKGKEAPVEAPAETVFVNPFDKAKLDKARPTAVAEILKTDEIVSDSDAKVKLALAHDSALSTLTKAIETTKNKLDDIKPERLPGVVTAMSKVVESIRKERIERDKMNRGGQDVHFHFYCPDQKKAEDYEVIEIG